VLSGSGDTILDVERGNEPSLIHITGNAGSRHFAIVSYNSSGERIDLLVNTTDPYDGVRPLDFLDSEHATRFEISATGSWTIEIVPVQQIERLDIPGEFTGTGDYVFAFAGGTPDTAKITGNASSRHFAVIGWGGNGRDLLVNTTDPYNGTVIVDRETFILEVKATGDWSINIATR